MRNNKERIVISLLFIWTFLNTIIILISFTESRKEREYFYPLGLDWDGISFNKEDINFDDMLLKYDISEYFVYVGTFWLCFLLYKYWNNK